MECLNIDQMTQEHFHNTFCGSRYSPVSDARIQVMALRQTVALLEEGRLDRKPRRDMVNKLRSMAAPIAEADARKAA